jgi:hypothetical protein
VADVRMYRLSTNYVYATVLSTVDPSSAPVWMAIKPKGVPATDTDLLVAEWVPDETWTNGRRRARVLVGPESDTGLLAPGWYRVYYKTDLDPEVPFVAVQGHLAITSEEGPIPTAPTPLATVAFSGLYDDLLDKPDLTAFAPAVHAHPITGVTGLETALAGKEASGTAAAAVTAHQDAADPHPQYLTTVEATSAYDPAGAAVAAVAAHTGAADPHPQYLTQTEGDTRYEQLPTGTTDLSAWLTTFTAGISSAQSYREPTTLEAADAVLGIERLALGADASTLLTPLGYTATTGIDSATGRPYALAVNEPGTDRSWGAYLVDLSRPIGLTVQCPHPKSDEHTELLALEHWRQTPGALLAIAGAHRDATGTLLGGYPLADPGKQVGSLFHQVIAAYSSRGVPGVQWHGYADASAPGLDYVVATGSGNAGPSPRRIAEEMTDAGFVAGRGWDSSGSSTGLIGLTNVQGDHAHSLGVPWTHIEVSATTRDNSDARDRAVAAVVAAQPELPGVGLMLAQPVTGQFPGTSTSANTVGDAPTAARANHSHRERQVTLDRITVVEARTAPRSSLLAQAFEPLNGATTNTGTGVTFTAGVLHLVRVMVPTAGTVSNLYAGIVTAGGGLTAGQCWAGLYSSVGTLLGQTTDRAIAWQTSGLQVMPLATPVAVTAGTCYVGILVNGTTLPTFARSAITVGGILTAGMSSGAHPQMTSGTAQTALPASVTMTSAAATSWVIWTGLA